MSSTIAKQIDAAAERFSQAVVHHVEVNAVLALVDQFQDRPELVAELASYSRQVVAAALMTRINGLAADITVVTKAMSRYELQAANESSSYRSMNLRNAKEHKTRLDELQAELTALNAVAQAGRLHSV